MPSCPSAIVALSLSFCLPWQTAGLAQRPAADPAVGAVEAKVAQAIRAWTTEYEAGRLGPKGSLHAHARLQPAYLRFATEAGYVGDNDFGRLTHLDMLQKLLYHAEKNITPELAEAVLGVAAAGLDNSVLDVEALELREVGHWTLMRVESQAAWFVVLREAAGERPQILGGQPADDSPVPLTAGASRRVAALRLLGQRGLPVFRSTLEAALLDAEPRVRLAAAESIQPPWRAATIERVAAALAQERHPVVSQALVRLLRDMLQRPPEDLDAEQKKQTVEGALAQLGRAGWRTDMELLDIVEAFPHKAAIPRLIGVLDLELRHPDALVSAVNERASPLLRERAGTLLKAMTGALVPIDDVSGWRDFWAAEQDNLVVPEQLRKPNAAGTRVTFFGVPVTGGSIAFLIDTSGSMDEEPAGAPATGPRARRARTRLEAAKEQLVLCTQAMDPESQFLVMTFSDQARRWTVTPLRPGQRTTRSLTELLSRMKAHGGTNLYAGLVSALEADHRVFGDPNLPTIDELFVLSDGEPTAGEVRVTEELLEIVAEANKYAKIRINTVFTGTGDGDGPDLLRRLAEQNGGVFVRR